MGLRLACLSIAIFASSAVQAQAVRLVDPASLSVTGLIDFTPLSGTDPINRDDIIQMNGAAFAEGFVGMNVQTFGAIEDYLGSAPTGPLTLRAGPARQNLVIGNDNGGFVAGLSSASGGFPSNAAIGEGMIAVQFDRLQSEIGFDLVGFDRAAGFSLVVDFWNESGGLIQRFVSANRQLALPGTSIAFQRDGGLADIAGISIVNSDRAGLGYNNFRLDVGSIQSGGSAIPEPANWVLLLAGFGLVGVTVRHRQRLVSRSQA